MPTSPSDLLQHAEQIRQARPDEVGWRCAASRAYYSAMMIVRITLPDVPSPGKLGTHERAIRQAYEYANSKKQGWELAATMAHQLRAMKTDRVVCDYHLHEVFTAADCERMLKRATAMHERCAQFTAKNQAQAA